MTESEILKLFANISKSDDLDNIAAAVSISLPVIVKAHQTDDGKRVVEVEASCEEVDSEGDVIEQKALLDSAASFVNAGHIDLDHISELGHRLGIPNPESFIIGRPTEVKDIGDHRTSVIWECFRSNDGSHNPDLHRYDAFWDSLQTRPPIKWLASVYGFPPSDSVIDCRGSNSACPSKARRYHIKAMDWRSLAMTRNPVQNHLKGYAKVVTAKAFLLELLKSGKSPLAPAMFNASTPGLTPPPSVPHYDLTSGANGFPYETPPAVAEGQPDLSPQAPKLPGVFPLSQPRTLTDAIGQYHAHMRRNCQHTEGLNTTIGFKRHFEECCGLPAHMAELFAHALMHHVLLDKRRA